MPTRFRYTKVEPSSFALTPTEILLATDAELNAYISLRKFAPYRRGDDDQKKSGKNKKRLKELRDALKGRQWGEDPEEAAEREAGRQKKKIKWSEETGRKKEKTEKEKKEGDDSGAAAEPKKKRAGKGERKRRKAQADAAAIAGGDDAKMEE